MLQGTSVHTVEVQKSPFMWRLVYVPQYAHGQGGSYECEQGMCTFGGKRRSHHFFIRSFLPLSASEFFWKSRAHALKFSALTLLCRELISVLLKRVHLSIHFFS